MMLICPATKRSHVDALIAGIDACVAQLIAPIP